MRDDAERVHADGELLEDLRVVAVVARLGPQLRNADAVIAHLEVVRLPDPDREHHRGDREDGHRAPRLDAVGCRLPHLLQLRILGGLRALRLGRHADEGQHDRQQHLVGEDHPADAEGSGDAELAHDVDRDQHDDRESPGRS
jgi:hypothetical protein